MTQNDQNMLQTFWKTSLSDFNLITEIEILSYGIPAESLGISQSLLPICDSYYWWALEKTSLLQKWTILITEIEKEVYGILESKYRNLADFS
jgi:hypothetical protein